MLLKMRAAADIVYFALTIVNKHYHTDVGLMFTDDQEALSYRSSLLMFTYDQKVLSYRTSAYVHR